MKLKIVTIGFFMIFQVIAFGQSHPFQAADWITVSYPEPADYRPVPIFKKDFRTLGKQIKSARLYITALGLYEASLNGKRIGNSFFTPGYTSYGKRLQYQVYDVSKVVKAGNKMNLLQACVAEGWYRGIFRSGADDTAKNNYGADAGLLVELVISYADGGEDKICSDDSWKCAESRIRYSQLYDGEFADYAYKITHWQRVKLLSQSKSIVVPMHSPPVRTQETFKPKSIIAAPNGEQIVDFGQNLAGWIRLKVKGKAGDTIKVSHAEVLDKNGNFYTGNLRSAKAQDVYVLKGGGQEILEPHFTYHGFRYAKISGTRISPDNCTAIALYSDLEKTGTFECSDPLLNRLQKNIEWSLNSNFFEVPTDCPQRSERLGWTGDAQVFAATASFLRNTKTFYQKWLKDLAVEQRSSGAVPAFVPTQLPLDRPVNGYAGWGDAAVIIPWTLYEAYGDTTVLRNQYTSMNTWVDYIKSRSIDGLWKDNGYGDWYAPGPVTDLPFVDQCFWAYSCSLLVKSAKVLGMDRDIESYSAMLEQVRKRFREVYLIGNGKLTVETQAAYVLALQFGLIPEDQRALAVKKLVDLLHANNDHLATGFLATPYLLQVLSDNGCVDLAYKLLMQRSYPSWLFPITMGATTIWEKWDGMDGDGTVKPTSYNHYSYGAVGQWLYENALGIKATLPGYRSFVIKPLIGGGLTWAKGHYKSVYGEISSSWRLKSNQVFMDVVVPPGTTAEVFVPGETSASAVGTGKYSFKGKINQR